MDPERWQRVEQLFAAAAALAPAERESFLDRECGGDPRLRAEVESLLEHDSPDGATIGEVVQEVAEQAGAGIDSPLSGRRVGPYRLEQEIGHGGMGVVYSASRDDQAYHKRVAIKLMRLGFSGDEAQRRFKSERQILANLEHTNIARLLDGGTTETDEPYVVMEFVQGQPIDDYCDARRLTLDQRLELFVQLCSAVHYAHQQSVVHRDIKPGNILVTVDGVPKLLDFGIAKLLDPEAMPHTVQATGSAMQLMTPEYASPEQLRREPITPVSDVYNLGLLLYELLSGHHPHRFGSAGPGELERTICERDPPRPSRVVTRATGSDGATADPTTIGQARRSRPASLGRALAGDLDTIVLKALRKEREHRYPSAAALAEDVRRYLDGLPITARPATLGYRLRKLVRRKPVHTVLLLTLALAMPTVAVLGLRTVRQAQTERRQRIDGLLQEARWLEERRRYAESLEKAEAVLDLQPGQPLALRHRAIGLVAMSQVVPDPEQAERLARLALEDAARIIEKLPDANWPYLLREYLLRALDREAEAGRDKAPADRQRRGPPTDEDLDLEARLALIAGDHARAAELFSELLLRRPDRASAISGRALALEELGDAEQAFSEYRVALGIDPTQDLTFVDLARISIDRGELDESEGYLEQALRLKPDSAFAHETRGYLLLERGIRATTRGENDAARELLLQAEASLGRSLELEGELLWPDANIANSMISRSRLEEHPDPALLEQAVERYQRVLDHWPDPPRSGQQRDVYSAALNGICDAQIQLRSLEAALETCRGLTRLDPSNAIAFYNLAGVQALSGRTDDALASLERDFELGDQDWEYLINDEWFAALRADPRFRELVERMKLAARAAGG